MSMFKAGSSSVRGDFAPLLYENYYSNPKRGSNRIVILEILYVSLTRKENLKRPDDIY